MGLIKVFRQGKGTFSEWLYENGEPLGRIRNQGEGVFIEGEFSSLEKAKIFCQSELEKDASPIFYVMQGNDIINTVYNRAYHIAKEKKENRIFAAASLVFVMLLATGASIMVMPFQTMIYHVLFIGGMGAFYLLMYSIGGNWNLESVAMVIMVIIMLSILVPVLTTFGR